MNVGVMKNYKLRDLRASHTLGWFAEVSLFASEDWDACMDLENFYVTLCFSHEYHLTVVEYIKPQNTESVCTTREKETHP